MKLEAYVTRFAPNDGFICDVDVHRKASEEEYDFRFISPSYYLCITESGNAYVISEYKNKIGCACQDMTFNRTGKEVCKHLEKFMRLKDISLPDISEDMAQLLKAAGWSGSVLTPPDRPENRKRQKLPNIKDPARKPAPQVAQREKSKEAYKGMTTEQIVRGMDIKELKRNATKGGIAAQAEMARREAEKEKAMQDTKTKDDLEKLKLIREMPQAKLETYARRGAPLAIVELTRRMAVKEAVSA